MEKKKNQKKCVGIATVTAKLVCSKMKIKRTVTTRFGFCAEGMNVTEKKALSDELVKAYEQYVNENILKDNLIAFDKTSYSCTFKTMQCDMLLGGKNE